MHLHDDLRELPQRALRHRLEQIPLGAFDIHFQHEVVAGRVTVALNEGIQRAHHAVGTILGRDADAEPVKRRMAHRQRVDSVIVLIDLTAEGRHVEVPGHIAGNSQRVGDGSVQPAVEHDVAAVVLTSLAHQGCRRPRPSG